MSKKIIGILIISVFVLSVNVAVTNASNVTLTLLTKTDTSNEDELVIAPNEESGLPENDISANNFTGFDSIIGEPLRVTPNQLYKDEYYSVMDNNGTFHTVWIQKLSHIGYSICYTHSNSSLGQNWSDYEIMFRLMYRISNIHLIVDDDGCVHIFFTTKSLKHYRLYYLFRDLKNITFDYEVLAETFDNEIYDISTIITENNTLHITWLTYYNDKHSDVWDSHLTYYSKNLTSQTWIGNSLILHNDTNPILASMSGNDEVLDILWSKSDYFNATQDLMLTTYNFTTSSWATELVKAENNSIVELDCQTSKIEGLHIMYVKYGAYEFLNYGLLLRNGTIVEFAEALNKEGYICNGFMLLEESSGNLTLMFEDYYGTSDVYLIKKEFGNSTWSSIIQLTVTDAATDIFIFPNPEVDILGTLFILVHGSIYTTQYYHNDTIGGVVRLLYATQATYEPTIVTDSEGITHMICYHEGVTGSSLLYQKLYPNATRWKEFQVIELLYHYTAPKLVIDSNDNFHVFYSQYDLDTGYLGMFYLFKNATTNSWSQSKLVHEPTNNVIIDYSPIVLFDTNESIHLIWRQASPENDQIYYAYKDWTEENFTTPELLVNYRNDTSPYQLDAMIDRDGTIHLANTEANWEYEITMIIYRSKSLGENWTDPLNLEASYNYLYKPMLIEDQNGDINLYYSDSIVLSWYLNKFESDIKMWVKPYGTNDWEQPVIVVKNCATFWFVTIEQAPDGTLFMVYTDAIYSISFWRDRNVDNITLIYKPVDGDWSEPQIVFTFDHEKTIPLPFYNYITDQFINIHQFNNILYWYVLQNDTDQDGLGDMDELVFCTDPNNPDSDSDGLLDGEEIERYNTNPIIADTDWDGLLDGQEIHFVNASDPTIRDTDRDGLSDGDEVLIYQSNPNSYDSDKDGLNDDVEVLELGSSPILRDTDSDGMDDNYEYVNGLDLLVDDSLEDPDNDLLSNIDEYLLGADLYNNDTDNDFIMDGVEFHTYHTSPILTDSDEDTLTDWEEIFKYNTDPTKVDSDSDGFTDREEINTGTDPNNPRDNVRLRQLRKVLLGTIIPVSLIIVIIIAFEFRYQRKKKALIANDADEIVREEAAIEAALAAKETPKEA
ncbi:MAG: hypothetical protein ACTSVP_04190 [Candidatus Heimdallarchaeota archaeon]